MAVGPNPPPLPMTNNIPSSWEAAMRLLTALPAPHAAAHGDVNFFCAGRYRRNGHKLFNEHILPLVESGQQLTVLLGFVDTSVARATGLGSDDPLMPLANEFRAVRLYNAAADKVYEFTID